MKPRATPSPAPSPAPVAAAGHTFALPALRHALHTEINAPTDPTPAPEPPAALFARIRYHAPLGDNVAYVTPPPRRPGARRPAIVWIAGGLDWGIGSSAWEPAPRANDQSARALREAGVVLMLPALRGSNGNPGHNECFLGEVDDILAAADALAKRPDVDPERIYLGGHSTGGTLALLAAESTDRFRAVFAFGPVADPRQYGRDGCLPSNASADEAKARAPIDFLDQIVTPTFVIEGGARGNGDVFPRLQARAGGAPLRFLLVPGGTHFTTLAPGTEVIARAILADRGDAPQLDVTVDAIAARLTAAP